MMSYTQQRPASLRVVSKGESSTWYVCPGLVHAEFHALAVAHYMLSVAH